MAISGKPGIIFSPHLSGHGSERSIVTLFREWIFISIRGTGRVVLILRTAKPLYAIPKGRKDLRELTSPKKDQDQNQDDRHLWEAR
jgi:hypothetical protein